MKKPLILIVDDSEKNLQLIGKFLNSLDVDMSFATSGARALSLATSIKPDLVLLDIIMPEMDGFQVCKHLVEKQETSDISIIFLSARTELNDIVEGFRLGARDYITKPVIKEELLARVKAQLLIKRNTDRLKHLNNSLEKIVDERTKELQISNQKLQKSNIALQVLLDKRENDRALLHENIIHNVEELVNPYIERLRNSSLSAKQREYVLICEKNLKGIISPFLKNIKTKLSGHKLTPKELLIANLIKQDKSSQEISDILNMSDSTVNFHRNNIRQKLGIKNRKVNLQSYLMTFDD